MSISVFYFDTLRGYPGFQKQYRATETILVIKVSYVLYSQPLTHGPVGYEVHSPVIIS